MLHTKLFSLGTNHPFLSLLLLIELMLDAGRFRFICFLCSCVFPVCPVFVRACAGSCVHVCV